MKIRKWRQAKRDKAIIIELEIGYHELFHLIYNQSIAGEQTRGALLDLIMPILDEAEEPQ